MGMSPRQRIHWERERSKGFLHYLAVHSLLIGGGMALVLALAREFLWDSPMRDNYLFRASHLVLIWLGFGMVIPAAIWWWNEREYRAEEE